MTACSSSFTEVVAMTLFNDVTTKIEPHSFQECRSDCQPATGKTSLGSFCPQRAMNTGPKALGVHGVPWQTYNYKSYKESLELKLHSVSKQTNKKKNQQNHCSDAGTPDVTSLSLETLSMHSYTGACAG